MIAAARSPRLAVAALWVAFLLAVLLAGPASAARPVAAAVEHPVVLATATAGVETPSLPWPAVKEAYDLLLDTFVIEPNPGVLLTNAWAATSDHLRRAGRPAPSIGPEFIGDRALDWHSFVLALLRASPGSDPNQLPAGVDAASIRGMVSAVGEAHTRYLPRESFQRFREEQRGNYGADGTGLSLAADFTVTDVVEASPADRAGVRVGDRLLAVNGQPTAQAGRARISELLASPAGTRLTLRVLRHDVGELEVSLATALVRPDWITVSVFDGTIGYLRVRRFEFLTGDSAQARARLLDAAIERLDRPEVRGIILDLRNNPGGSVSTGQALLGRLLPRGTALYQLMERGQAPRTITARGRPMAHQVPLVVLVNRGSASMSEIVAAALRESGRARLVGLRTLGAVATSTLHPLSDGSGLSITTALVATASGASLNGIGLAPDVSLELSIPELWLGRDTQLEAARRELGRMMGAVAEAEADAPEGFEALPAAA